MKTNDSIRREYLKYVKYDSAVLQFTNWGNTRGNRTSVLKDFRWNSTERVNESCFRKKNFRDKRKILVGVDSPRKIIAH